MFYPEDIVEEVRTKNDIVDVDFRICETAEKGKLTILACAHFIMKNLLPFLCLRRKQMYYCFGCGAGGNVHYLCDGV